MIFRSLDIAAFENTVFRTSFEEDFTQELAFSAGVSRSDVVINNIRSGSVRVDSTVYFSGNNKGNLESFMSQLQKQPAEIFTAEFLQPYGDVVAIDVSNVSMLYSYPQSPVVQQSEQQPPPDVEVQMDDSTNLTGASRGDNLSPDSGPPLEPPAETSRSFGSQITLLPLVLGGGLAFALLSCVLGICMYRMKVAKAKQELTTEWTESVNPVWETSPTVL